MPIQKQKKHNKQNNYWVKCNWKLFVKGELYNLKEDLAETKNVAKTNPDVVKRLQGMLDEFAAEIRDHARPVGVAANSRTLTPRPGIEGEAGFLPTLSLPPNPTK